jgi:hypothetical protein
MLWNLTRLSQVLMKLMMSTLNNDKETIKLAQETLKSIPILEPRNGPLGVILGKPDTLTLGDMLIRDALKEFDLIFVEQYTLLMSRVSNLKSIFLFITTFV